MCKSSHFTVRNQENSEKIQFSPVKNFKVEATTDAMNLSSHGGLLMLRQEEEHLALASQLASCIEDRRTPCLIRHDLTEIIMTRIFQICLGYEDVNDCDRLSCHTFKANRLRIFIYAAAYILMHSMRERALRGTSLEKASILTIREKLLLYAVSVRILKTKVILDFAKQHPMKEELRHTLHYYSVRDII